VREREGEREREKKKRGKITREKLENKE